MALIILPYQQMKRSDRSFMIPYGLLWRFGLCEIFLGKLKIFCGLNI